jgi:hypothetical protein
MSERRVNSTLFSAPDDGPAGSEAMALSDTAVVQGKDGSLPNSPFRALLVMGLFCGAALACETKPSCTTEDCPSGCCDAAGLCKSSSDLACGVLGNACQTCLAGQTCRFGACVGSNFSGAGGSSGTGGSGGGGGGSTTGGSGGGSGSVTPDGGGNAADAGRPNGGGTNACVNCTTGCCFDGSCLSGTLNLACGANGNACVSCPANTGCINGQCRACNASTCPTGCCDDLNQCQLGTGVSGCGLGGRCEVCPINTQCTSRACIATPPAGGLPGAGCSSDSMCLTSEGTNTGEPGSCLSRLLPDGGVSPWVGGYCNPECTALNTCLAGTCVSAFGGKYCLGNCTVPGGGKGSCRSGYVCGLTTLDGRTPTWGVCVPDCRNAGLGCSGGQTCNTLGYCE